MVGVGLRVRNNTFATNGCVKLQRRVTMHKVSRLLMVMMLWMRLEVNRVGCVVWRECVGFCLRQAKIFLNKDVLLEDLIR